jgi:hypothetical protein
MSFFLDFSVVIHRVETRPRHRHHRRAGAEAYSERDHNQGVVFIAIAAISPTLLAQSN